MKGKKKKRNCVEKGADKKSKVRASHVGGKARGISSSFSEEGTLCTFMKGEKRVKVGEDNKERRRTRHVGKWWS